ncbi:MAG: TonB-dependent receptor [Nitrospirota bacterium]
MTELFLSALAVVILQGTSSAQEPTPVFAAADETLLFQEIPSVVGASKYEQKVTEAPSAVSIITSVDIKKFGYRTLADLLRSVRSFYVTYDRNYSYVGARGFGRPADYNTRVLVLIDGHRANDNVYDGAYLGTESIVDLDLVDRVEVIRGPGSSLYGSNAFFAVVNVITKRGRDLKGGEVSAEAGSFDTYKGRATYGDRFKNGMEALVSATGYDSKGQRLYYTEYDAPATNNGATNNTDYDRFQSFFAKLSHHDMTLSGAYLSRTKGIPTGAFGTDFNDPGNRTGDERAYLDLKYERSLSARTDVAVRLYYDRYRYEGDYLYYQDGDPTTGLNKDIGAGDWWGAEVRVVRNYFDSHRIIVGAEYQGNLRQDQENYSLDPYTVDMPKDERRSRNAAAYLQDEIAISRSMMLTAGVRYDHYSTFGGTTNPRLAFIYNAENRSTVKVIYGSAFRTPNSFELYWHSPDTDANPDLKPERIKTYEVVYETFLTERLHASVAGYYYRISDLISQTTTGTGNTIFENMGNVSAKGSEVELGNKWKNGVEGRVSYTVQRAEDKATGEPLTNSPAQMAKLNVAVPVMTDKMFVGLEEQYMGRRRTENGGFTSDFAVTNLTLYTQNILKRFEVSASVYNLFDRQFGDPVSLDFVQNTILQDGRSYRLKLVYAF